MSIIHVNSNVIRSNRKRGESNPPLSIRKTRSAKAIYANEVLLKDSLGNVIATVVYKPETPLSCGAQVWIETEFDVEVIKDN
jgi:hypothetical protein